MTPAPQLVRLMRLAPAIGWMAVIFALSSQSTTPQPPGLSQDLTAIAGHLVAYAILAGLLVFGLSGLQRASYAILLLAVVLATMYGVTDEFHQSFVTGRHADPVDVVTDLIGALVGAAIWNRVSERTLV